jgi:hypothetical protein
MTQQSDSIELLKFFSNKEYEAKYLEKAMTANVYA